jgi:hypothetical protein
MKSADHVGRSKPRRRKATTVKRPLRGPFIGTRPLKFPMTLRGQVVDVEVRPAVGTATHVNYVITISRGGKVLDWVPSRAELVSIGRTAAMRTEIQTSH